MHDLDDGEHSPIIRCVVMQFPGAIMTRPLWKLDKGGVRMKVREESRFIRIIVPAMITSADSKEPN